MENLHNKIREVMKVASCPVCFERLPPDVVCCVNGHAMCRKCKMTLTQCPTCRNPFSAEGHTFITQLLEALPYLCTNEGCPETLLDKSKIEAHEKLFCSYRFTKCKGCLWTGKLKDLKNHLETSSCEDSKGNCNTEAELELLIDIHDPEPSGLCLSYEHDEYYLIMFSEYYEQLFWRTQTLNMNKYQIKLHYICLPNEEAMKSCFIVNVEFQLNDTKLTAETKLTRNYEDGVLEGFLIFDTEMLKNLKRKDHTLTYKFSIKKVDGE